MSAPLVTGISPKEGPPGTKVTIRGERLGKSQADIIALDICGINCLLTAEWVSPKKIMARTLVCRGKGEVVIVTKSGGIGTCTVQFRGSQDSVSLTKESAVWVDEGTLVGPRPMSKSSLQQDDPLQISLEANEKKFPVEELSDSFPGKCGNFCAENYSPQWFLLEFHHATAFEDLKSGLHYLGRKIGSQSEGKISFLKENLHMVMDQLDSLSELRKVCDKHDDSRTSSTNHGRIVEIDEQIAVCEKEAARMFLEVLTRKDRADITRSALGGYQRFRFLLGLPATMQRSIDNGDYDIAISDYTRSKALFLQAEAQKSVFQKFQLKVEQIATTLRDNLKAKLVRKPPNLDDQRLIISYLLNLEVDYDPAWTCLQSHYEFLTISLRNCFKILSESTELQQKSTNVDTEQVSSIREVNCVDSICEIFCGYFVAFWQLSQEYFGGKLRIKPELSKQADVKVMMLSTVETFCEALSACIMPDATKPSEFIWKNPSPAQVRWISLCLNSVRKTYTKVLLLDPPMEISEAFRSLLFDIRSYSLSVMANQMSVEVSELSKFEDWSMEYQKENGFITALPSKFESVVMNSAKLMKEMILQKYSKEKSLMKSQHVLASLTENVANACSSFADAIETLLTEQKNVLSTIKSEENNRGYTTVAMRLLLMLNNCSYVRNTTFPSLTRALSSLGFPSVSSALAKSDKSVTNVERLVFTHYTEMKYEPVVGMIEQAMFVGAFDWEKLGEPTGVRPYISKVLMGLVQIIAEVTTVSEKLTYRVMSQVIESVAEELLRLYSCVATFSHGGAIQAVTDVLAFKHAVQPYLSSSSKSLLQQAVELLPSSDVIMKSKDVSDLLDQYKTNSALQLQPLGL